MVQVEAGRTRISCVRMALPAKIDGSPVAGIWRTLIDVCGIFFLLHVSAPRDWKMAERRRLSICCDGPAELRRWPHFLSDPASVN